MARGQELDLGVGVKVKGATMESMDLRELAFLFFVHGI